MSHNGRNHGKAMRCVSISKYSTKRENELVNKIVKKETATSVFSDTVKSKPVFLNRRAVRGLRKLQYATRFH